jgi:hypothetical protein
MDWKRAASNARDEEGGSAEDNVEAGADRLAEGLADIIAEAERINAAEVEKLRNRVEALERRLANHGGVASEAASEPAPGNSDRVEPEGSKLRLLVDLRRDMGELRAAMIKLSGHVKALAGE